MPCFLHLLAEEIIHFISSLNNVSYGPNTLILCCICSYAAVGLRCRVGFPVLTVSSSLTFFTPCVFIDLCCINN